MTAKRFRLFMAGLASLALVLAITAWVVVPMIKANNRFDRCVGREWSSSTSVKQAREYCEEQERVGALGNH
jgi:Na+-transporting methylmalonyl-CoA/oxaloacetate decarboxylase gamma subunit